MKRLLALLCLVAAGGAAFGQFRKPGPVNVPPSTGAAVGDEVNWSPFQTGAYSNAATQGVFVLGGQNQYQQFWTRLTGQPGNTAPTGMNWGAQKLVAVTLGARRTGGYQLVVQDVRRLPDGTTVVRAIERTPIDGQWVSKTPTAPYELLRVPANVTSVKLDIRPYTNANIQLAPGAYFGGPGGREGEGFGPETGPNAVNFVPYGSGVRSLVENQAAFLLEDQTQLARYWQEQLGRPADSTPTNVDWSQEKLLAVHLGTRESSGYSVTIAGLHVNPDGAVTVRAVERRPTPGSWATRHPTSPFVVVRVPRTVSRISLSVLPAGD